MGAVKEYFWTLIVERADEGPDQEPSTEQPVEQIASGSTDCSTKEEPVNAF